MLNGIFLVLIAGSVLTAAFRGTMPRVTDASLTAAKASVDLALGLVGQMALWLGMMAIVREGGLMRSIARGAAAAHASAVPGGPRGPPGDGLDASSTSRRTCSGSATPPPRSASRR